MAVSSEYNVRMIPVQDVFVVGARRSIDEAAVHSLVASIEEIGLRTPITVRVQEDVENPETGEVFGSAYAIITGLHRLEAFKRLGRADIPAIVRDCDQLDAELWEIDENLVRAELGAADRASCTARRKEIYESIHGNPKAIGAHAANAAMGHKHDANANFAFASDTAAKTGRSERTVQLDAERGSKIAPDVMAMIRGTKLDNGAYLDMLKRRSPEKQWEKAEFDLQDIEDRKRRRTSAVIDIPEEKDWEQVEAEQKRRLMQVWNGCSPNVQRWFLDEVDRPAFDNTHAGRAA